MAHRKQRMQGMVDQVNANANGEGNVLSSAKQRRQDRKTERKYGSADLGMMNPEEKSSYETGMKKGMSERKMVKKGLIPQAMEHHRYEYNISGKIKRDESGHYEDIPKTTIGPIIDPVAKKKRQEKRATSKQKRTEKRHGKKLGKGETMDQTRLVAPTF